MVPRSLYIGSARKIVKSLFLLHFRGIPAGGANEVQRVPPRGVCACLSIYLELSDFYDETKRRCVRCSTYHLLVNLELGKFIAKSLSGRVLEFARNLPRLFHVGFKEIHDLSKKVVSPRP